MIATGVIGGGYMLLIALSSISFRTFADRYRKLAVMRFAAGFTLVMFVLSGLSGGLLGMGWAGVVVLVLTVLAFAHLLTLRMPEEVRPAATDAHGGFDLRGATGFLVGGALIGRFGLGPNPLRTMLVAVIVMGFLIAPIAQLWIIPYALSAEGAAQLAPLLGEGTSRGIALVFLVAGIAMIATALPAFLTLVYRRVSASYARVAAENAGEGVTASWPTG